MEEQPITLMTVIIKNRRVDGCPDPDGLPGGNAYSRFWVGKVRYGKALVINARCGSAGVTEDTNKSSPAKKRSPHGQGIGEAGILIGSMVAIEPPS